MEEMLLSNKLIESKRWHRKLNLRCDKLTVPEVVIYSAEISQQASKPTLFLFYILITSSLPSSLLQYLLLISPPHTVFLWRPAVDINLPWHTSCSKTRHIYCG